MKSVITKGNQVKGESAERTTGLGHLLYIFAFISGGASLLYQVVWVHMLTLTFGNTTEGAAIVVGAFFLGLGLGARGYEWMQTRWRRVLTLYALIELGIAVLSVGISVNLYALPGFYAHLSHALGSGLMLHVVRAITAFLVLLLPSLLIGATFPALCTILIRSRQGVNRHFGMIYGINTLGASAGTVAGGLILIEQFGNLGTIWIAAAGNLLIALAVALTARSGPDLPEVVPDPVPEKRAPTPSLLSPTLLATVLAISGFATMSFEIIWIRASRYLVGNSTYAISIVITLFLIGLGLGGTLHRWVVRRSRSVVALSTALILSGLLCLASLGALGMILSDATLAERFSIFSDSVRFLPWIERLLLTGGISTVLLLPVTLVMGLVFPLAGSLFIDQVRILGRRVGSAYLFSTVGSIVGLLVTAMVLLPGLGIGGSTKLVSVITLVGGLLVLFAIQRQTSRIPVFPLAATLPVIALLIAVPAKLPFSGEQERGPDHRLKFWEEGEQATVKVIERSAQGGKAMTVDGYTIGVSADWHREAAYKQQMLAHLAMAIRPDARHTLNIGLGSSSTLASLSHYRGIESLECVEIAHAVLDGAHEFAESSVLSDPRTRVTIDDAVHFLLRSDSKYDVIISDGKQNPQFPGNSLMLAGDFYDLVLNRLSDRGVMVQWIPQNFPDEAFAIVLRTFCEKFPYSAIYYYPPSCLLMAGSPSDLWGDGSSYPLVASLPPQAVRDLSPYYLASTMEILAGMCALGSDALRALPAGPVNTWDHPWMEFLPYKQWRPEFNRDYIRGNTWLVMAAGLSALNRAIPFANDTYRPYLQSAAVMRAGYMDMMHTLDPQSLAPYCAQALQINPKDTFAEGSQTKIPRGLRALMIPGQ